MPSDPLRRDALDPRLRSVGAVVFDTDGVLIDSAPAHAAAWKEAFDAALHAHGDSRPFDAADDYRRYVDGRSRFDGAAAFLAARGLRLPAGDPGDPPGTSTVWAIAAAKERSFTARLRQGGIGAWPGSVRLVRALQDGMVPCAAVSASRHARGLLLRAGLLSLFQLVVDGQDAARRGLAGKPDPALFLEAVRQLGAAPEKAAVVEDALAGVEAGHRGGFGLVIGVDRAADPDGTAELYARGADVVVRDLAELLTAEDG